MSYREIVGGVLRWFRGDGEGTLYVLDANEEEAPLPVGDEAQVLTVVSGVPAWADAAGGTGSVDPAEVSGVRGWLAAMAPLFSPNFHGTPKKNGVALATTADIPAAADPASDQFVLANQIFGA